MSRLIHDKFYVRTPDLSVYENAIKSLPEKTKSADKPFRVPVHASPLKVNDKLKLNLNFEDQRLYHFPQTARAGRMTS